MAASSQNFSPNRVIHLFRGCPALDVVLALAPRVPPVLGRGRTRGSVSARMRGPKPVAVVLRSFVDLLPTGSAAVSV